jgi:hypothetical protein
MLAALFFFEYNAILQPEVKGTDEGLPQNWQLTTLSQWAL